MGTCVCALKAEREKEAFLQNLHPQVSETVKMLSAIVFASASITLKDAIDILEREVKLPSDSHQRFVVLYQALEALKVEGITQFTTSYDPFEIELGVVTGTIQGLD